MGDRSKGLSQTPVKGCAEQEPRDADKDRRGAVEMLAIPILALSRTAMVSQAGGVLLVETVRLNLAVSHELDGPLGGSANFVRWRAACHRSLST